MSIKVSFIIPSYNSLSTLPRTLDSILRQTVPAEDFEIIVVDSSDDEMAKKHLQVAASEQIRVISLEKKTMPAEGRNIGAKQAQGELLCFIDSDVILSPDWLSTVLTAFDDGCRAGGGSILISASQENNRIALAQLYLQFNEYLTGRDREERQFVPSCNMFCDRQIFVESGGFPLVRASEDTLFFLGLKGKTRVFFVPQAKCYHVFREAKEAFLNNQFLLGRYVSIYRREYYKSWMYQGIIPLVLTPLFLTIKLVRIVARVAKAGHLKIFLQSSPDFFLGFMRWSAGFVNGFVYDDGNPRS